MNTIMSVYADETGDILISKSSPLCSIVNSRPYRLILYLHYSILTISRNQQVTDICYIK